MEVEVFNGIGKPIITVDSIGFEDCAYHVTFYLDVYDVSGIMYMGNEGIWIEPYKSSLKAFLLFDLRMKSGGRYVIELQDGENRKTNLQVKKEAIFHELDETVHLMRIRNGMDYEGYPLDMVFLVSARRGIIGSYLSTFPEENQKVDEYYINPWGEVNEFIDFSRKERRVLE